MRFGHGSDLPTMPNRYGHVSQWAFHKKRAGRDPHLVATRTAWLYPGEDIMTTVRLTRAVITGALFAGIAALSPAAAYAGSCPADKMGTDVRAPDNTAAKDVTDTVLTSIDVAKEPSAIAGR